MTFEAIKSRIDGRVGIITLNRPKVLNALNSVLMTEVNQVMADFIKDDSVLAIVIHGEGRAFSAGFDLKESAARKIEGTDAWRKVLEYDFNFIMQFWDCPKPTIAAVHGFCLAGAFELALCCDMTVAEAGTRFGEPEVRFGSGIICLLLPFATSPKFAKELLLTGNDKIDAERAMAMGIVNHVAPAGQYLERAMELARDLCAAAPLSVQMTKRAINRGYDITGLRQALLASLDADIIIESSTGAERLEFNRIRGEKGLKAALAWRDAKFKS
ncbi:MAG: enoyl-CoA hydratase/isomerase family protein [Alphaproteobacteria bacterium]|nr:enoyl-CoA hydratase/isomerase family protein [Alphaproteobacteria bacterium]